MSQFLTFKTSKALLRKPSPQGSTNPTAKAVQFVLKGKYSSLSDAFAHDKHTLDKVAKANGDPVTRNHGVMAGTLRRP
jgi:hypothetical protein